VFIPDTKVGDEVKVKITSVRRRFAFAEKVE
jgi:predicted RNA-binding protein with TRAM domain